MCPIILLVEDDELIRELAADALSMLDAQVIACPSADDALKVLEQASTVNLVLTDIRMPGTLDGLQLCQSHIREMAFITDHRYVGQYTVRRRLASPGDISIQALDIGWAFSECPTTTTYRLATGNVLVGFPGASSSGRARRS